MLVHRNSFSLSTKTGYKKSAKLESLFDEYDRNGDGSIDYEEFQSLMQENFRA